MKRGFLQILTLLLILTMAASCSLWDSGGTEESSAERTEKVTDPATTETQNSTTEPNSDETTKPNPDPDPPTPDDPTPEKPIDPIIPLPTGTVKIACVGDSLTFGANATPYPAALQALLGTEWHEVRNFGAEGRTMTLGLSDPPNMTDRSYYDTKQYKDSLVYQPDIVILCLGTNDAWRVEIASEAGKAGYVQGLTKLVNSYYEAGVQQVYVCLPPDCVTNNIGDLVEKHVIPLSTANAEGLNYKIIDCFTPTKDRSDYLQSDQLHLNTQGYAASARTVFEVLVNSDTPNVGVDEDFIPITVVDNEKIKNIYDFEEKFG